MVLFRRIIRFFKNQDKLEDKIFSVVLIVGVFVVVASTVVTYAEQISSWATVLTALSGMFMIFLLILAYVVNQMEVSRMLMCYFINIVMMPALFFSCGGIDSGMPLYLLAGLLAIVLLLKGKNRICCFAVCLAVDVCSIAFSYVFMEGNSSGLQMSINILSRLSLEDCITDMISSIILVSLFVGITTGLILASYQKERVKRENLLIRLNDLSRKDELTGLYNRRELFSYLEDVDLFSDRKYYMAMFDIDHFKDVNDNYGHIFGDKALRRVAESLGADIDHANGEIAARYGGEEFVLLLNCKGLKEALDRVEVIRKKVEGIKWDEDEGLTITVSGGLVDCSTFNSLNTTLSTVDKLLYDAKHTGRNRISLVKE